ncbi:13551_t:CDS:2 [Acaulospora colombiana]|uniref:13551_t:CDS:1 n=1 Tax=Acaulospora colombiana TaxID=27376 RepID=A0ACA9KJQ6_9GLOM|nr:13551_t:CDS:2 [Acaulospora colombiana]
MTRCLTNHHDQQKSGEISQCPVLQTPTEQNPSDKVERSDNPVSSDNDVKTESPSEEGGEIAPQDEDLVESEGPVVTEENKVKGGEVCDEKSPKEPLKIKVENINDNTLPESTLKPPQNNKRMHGEDDRNPEEKALKRQQLERNKNKDDDKLEHAVTPFDQKPITENIKPVLVDNDTELPNLLKALRNIHKKYYEEYDSQDVTREDGERRTPDLTKLIPHLKKQRGTEKVKEAKRKGNVFIVSKEWLDESIKKWERQPEKAFMIEESSPFEPPDLNSETTDVTDEEGIFPLNSEKFKEIDWIDVMKEIDDEIGESGDTSAFDESETESGTESNGRKRLKRNSEGQPRIGERPKRTKQSSPLRQSIMLDNAGFELSSESFYQHPESLDETQEDYQYENNEDYDPGNQSDEEYDPGDQSDDEDSDDEKFIHDFEEFLKEDGNGVEGDVFISHEKGD